MERPKTDEDTDGATVGGESIFGNLAFFRIKLGLTDAELMKKSWISVQIESYDMPYWDSKAKHIITSKSEADEILSRYFDKK